jgi:hypothetical protein
MNASRVAGHGPGPVHDRGRLGTARNMLRMLVQSGLAKGRPQRPEARICWTINGIVAPVTESLVGGHPEPTIARSRCAAGIVTCLTGFQEHRSSRLSRLITCNSETHACVSIAKRCMTRNSVRSVHPRCLHRLPDGSRRPSVVRVHERLHRTSAPTSTASFSTPNRVHRLLVACSKVARWD